MVGLRRENTHKAVATAWEPPKQQPHAHLRVVCSTERVARGKLSFEVVKSSFRPALRAARDFDTSERGDRGGPLVTIL